MKTFHGKSETRTYHIWEAMIQRCTNPKATSYGHYGARGIRVDESWFDFRNFLADMKECPPGFSIDRIDPTGPYCRANCRWADEKTQRKNKGTRKYPYKGEVVSLAELSRQLHIPKTTLLKRVRNWPWKRVVGEPKRHWERKVG